MKGGQVLINLIETEPVRRLEYFPPQLDQAGRRLFYRLLTKFKISDYDIQAIVVMAGQARFPDASCDVWWEVFNQMTVEEFLFWYFKDKEVKLTKQEIKNMVAGWEFAQKDKVPYMGKLYLMKETMTVPCPKTVADAKLVSYTDFERGEYIGKKLYDCCRWLLLYAVKNNKNILVYGRDGEIIYDALNWLQKQMKTAVTINYTVCSRNQAAILIRMAYMEKHGWKKRKKGSVPVNYRDDDGHERRVEVFWSEYEEFLGKLMDKINPKTIHVDTGYKGSIPKMLYDLFFSLTNDSQWQIKPDIRLLSSHFPEYAMGDDFIQKESLKMDSIVAMIEHKDQNLRRTYHLRMKKNPRSYNYHAFKQGVLSRMEKAHYGG